MFDVVNTNMNPFESNTVKTFLKGCHRAISPAKTIERVSPFFEKIGITRIANVTGLDRLGIPVIMVTRPNSRSLSVSQGKGVTLDAAKASGVMESIELYHGEHVHLPLILASYNEVKDKVFYDPWTLPLVKGSKFKADKTILWVGSKDISTAKSNLIPFEIVHTIALDIPPTGSGCFLSTSNGLASGNTISEALLHGLTEVIERDNTTLWEAQGVEHQRSTVVDISSIDNSNCQQLIKKIMEADFSITIFNTTSDVGIPGFLVEIEDRLWDPTIPRKNFTGMGCHLNKAIALSRALTEAAQCRLTMISGARDDLFYDEYDRVNAPKSYAKKLKLKDTDISKTFFSEIPDYQHDTVEEDIKVVVTQLGKIGLSKILWVNLTKAEFNIPVVRVVVPGLEGPDEDPDYVPGQRVVGLPSNCFKEEK